MKIKALYVETAVFHSPTYLPADEEPSSGSDDIIGDRRGDCVHSDHCRHHYHHHSVHVSAPIS